MAIPIPIFPRPLDEQPRLPIPDIDLPAALTPPWMRPDSTPGILGGYGSIEAARQQPRVKKPRKKRKKQQKRPNAVAAVGTAIAKSAGPKAAAKPAAKPAAAAKKPSAGKGGGGRGGGGGGGRGTSSAGGGGGVAFNPAAQARQMVDALLAPQRLALDTQATTQQQAIEAFTKALMGIAGEQVGPVGQDYDNAIAQQAALAAESRAGLAASSPNADIQADLAAIGAPDAQKQQVADQLANVFGGGGATLFETGGRIPGASLAANKAAELAYAREIPGIIGLQGGQNLATALAAAAQKRAELEATVPGLILQTQSSLADQEIKQQALQINASLAGVKLADAQSRIKARDAKTKIDVASAIDRQRRWAIDTFGFDPQSGLTTVEYKRYLLAEKKASQTSKKGGFTAKQRKDMQAEAFATAQADFVGGYTDSGGNFVETGKRRPVETLKDMLASGIPFDIAVKALQRFWPHTQSWSKK